MSAWRPVAVESVYTIKAADDKATFGSGRVTIFSGLGGSGRIGSIISRVGSKKWPMSNSPTLGWSSRARTIGWRESILRGRWTEMRLWMYMEVGWSWELCRYIPVSERGLYSMHSVILSKWRDRRMRVIWQLQDLGALPTVQYEQESSGSAGDVHVLRGPFSSIRSCYNQRNSCH